MDSIPLHDLWPLIACHMDSKDIACVNACTKTLCILTRDQNNKTPFHDKLLTILHDYNIAFLKPNAKLDVELFFNSNKLCVHLLYRGGDRGPRYKLDTFCGSPEYKEFGLLENYLKRQKGDAIYSFYIHHRRASTHATKLYNRLSSILRFNVMC